MAAPSPTRSATKQTENPLLIVLALAMVPALGLGFARFAYALVLPDMRADLHWSYADAGWMNTSNGIGYLLGALLASRLLSYISAYKMMVINVWITVLSLALCAVFRDTMLLNFARFLAGLSAGLAFVAGGLLATALAQRHPERGSVILGIFYAGPGIGIFLSGLVLPFLLDWQGAGSWPIAWAVLAIMSVPLALLLFGARNQSVTIYKTGAYKTAYRPMIWMLVAYLIFGAGYIAYMTFMIAWVQNSGGGAMLQSSFWFVIGLGAISSPWVCAGIQKNLLHGNAFALLALITMAASLLPIFSSGIVVLMISAACFGGAFFAVVASTTVFVRRNFPPQGWAAAIGMMTVMFSIGQIFGPVVIGLINDLTHSLSSGLWASAALLLLAVITGYMQHDLKQTAG